MKVTLYMCDIGNPARYVNRPGLWLRGCMGFTDRLDGLRMLSRKIDGERIHICRECYTNYTGRDRNGRQMVTAKWGPNASLGYVPD